MILKKLSFVLALVVLVGLALPCFAETVTYQYDDLYRLIKATYSDGTVIEYIYDAAGNRQSVIKTPPAQALTVAISADPVSIQSGASSTLTWTSADALSCTIDQGVGAVNPSGTATVSPTTTTTYTITATGPGGTAFASTTVTVTTPPPAPAVSISANPTSIQSGGSSTLTWISTNADSCTIDQGIGTVNPTGTTTVSPTATTTYTITATGTGGTTFASVTVTVLPASEFLVTVATSQGTRLTGVTVYAFTGSGSYTGKSATTDGNGQAHFPQQTLADGAYKFRVDYLGYQFWSTVVTIPAVSSVEVTIPEEQVEVQVTTSTGPATGVRVYLFTESGTYLGLNQQTDSAGKVSFDLPVGKNYKFRADVAGNQYWSAVHTVTAGGVNTVTVNAGGGRLQVMVQKAPGVPLAGIKAYLFTASGTYLSLSQVTDASGIVAFTVPTGSYKVRADYLGYQFWSEQTQVTGDAAIVLSIPHQSVEITLRGVFQGAVEPFAGVTAYLFTDAGTYLSQNLQTNAQGTVTFDLPEKPYKIRADYLGKQYWSEEFVWQNKTVSIPMADAEITVTGGSMPQQGIKVYVFSASGTYLGLNQATTQAGTVAFHLPAQSYKFRVDYQGSQYWSTESPLTADQVNSISVSVGGGSFTINVLIGPAAALAGVKCYAFTSGGTYLGMSDTTDANGSVAFALANGAYKFRVDYQGYQFWSEVVTIPAVSSVDVTIPVEQVEVQVTTSTGPAQGVRVYLFTESGTYLGLNQQTDAAGKVSFALPVGKNYKFRADVMGNQYWSTVHTVTGEGVNQVAVNAAGGRFQVTVQKAPDVPMAGITAYLFTAAGTYLSLSQVTDANGMAAFTVPAGSYKVRADYLGYQFWSERAQVTADTGIVLSIPHQQVEVQVTTSTGPASGVRVYLFSGSGTYLGLNQQTDSAGKVSFDLPVGKNYKFRADVAGSQYWSTVITVAGGGVNTVTINTGG
jgi:YD repeat-containing protein